MFGAGLWVVATGASALTLGASRGAVVLGGPVDLTFEVQPDPGSDVASSCIDAALRAGDTPIGAAKVRVTPLADAPGAPGRTPAVRVQAAVAVDEPVLTVTLTAGCAGKTTRTYTFLADFPLAVPRTAAPVDVARLAQAAQGGAAAPAAAPSTETASPPRIPPQPAPAERAAPRVPQRPAVRPPQSADAVPPARTAPRAAQQATPRSRLVVEPLDVWLDSPLTLRPSMELLTTPSEEATAKRAEAAAQWKALNVQPQDLQDLQDTDRVKALEAEAAALRDQASRDRAAAAQLQQQLAQAEEERFPATVVYALAALLLLALLALARTWVRLRSASDKAVAAWRDSVALGNREAQAAHDAAMGLTPHPNDTWTPSDALPTPSGMVPVSAPVPVYEPFVSTSPAVSGHAPRDDAARPAAAPKPALRAVPTGAASVPTSVASSAPAAAAAMHIVNPEELFDVQQQAEFFVSVGEHQQAIDVLRKHIAEHRESSPLAYLELLRLYHTLSRVDEFTQLRKQFMLSFNAQVPEFTGFHRTGRMLYHYTDALAEIEAEWTSPSVLILLEKFLFRSPGGEAVEPFDLAAYDDLLLLLSIAQTTPASARGEPPPRKRTTPLAPPRTETLVVEAPVGHRRKDDRPPDSMASSLEFDFDLVPSEVARQAAAAQVATAPAALDPDSRSVPLDLDLSDPPHLTLSDLPPVPVTAPPPAGQPVGFGMDNDLMELRLELEQQQQQLRKTQPK
ncbi:hypothetical protein [Acidovorax sp.]|uniref:hypothetical protein n=1 Tax=Acidovorax sp. TaxID=1872122 RepID=UPI00391AB444